MSVTGAFLLEIAVEIQAFYECFRDGWMPMHYVAEENHLLMATLLLSHHASVAEKEE
jgi:ankyrin repeat protein